MKEVNSQQLESWKTVLPQLGKRHQEIITIMLGMNGEATIGEIATKLGKQLNQVSGRITELRKRDILIDSGEVRNNERTGRKMTLWGLNHSGLEKYFNKLKEVSAT